MTSTAPGRDQDSGARSIADGRVDFSPLRLASIAPAVVILATVAWLAANDGGFFASAWFWATLAFLWAVAIALLAGGAHRPSLPELAFVAAAAGLAGWAGLSALWSSAPALAIAEGQRTLLYAVALAVTAVVLRRRDVELLLSGLVLVVTAVSAYALSTRFWPGADDGDVDPITRFRLAEPLGYWNALGAFAGIGVVLTLGLAHESKHLSTRMLASAAPVVLAPTIYFTFGRGGWLAIAFGVAAITLLAPRRLHFAATLAVAAPWAALAVWLAARSEALARPAENLEAAARDGRNLALLLVLLCVGAAAGSFAFARLERAITVPRRVRRAGWALGTLVVVTAIGLVLAWHGSPLRIAEKAKNQFQTSPPSEIETDPRSRLFAASGNGRTEQWNVAVDMFHDEPMIGLGAGTYQREWVLRRESSFYVRDAHNLYLETAGELGVVGVGLLGLLFLVPFAAAVRARGRPALATALGGLTAYAVHAALDWDWELPAITLAGLLCGSCILLAARADNARPLRARARLAIGVGALTLAAGAAAALIGYSVLEQSQAAADAGRSRAAEADARLAVRWLPWSPDPWQLVGRAQLARGERAAARASFLRATEQDDGDWKLWAQLALSSAGEQRRRALARAVALNPLGDVENEIAAAARIP
ncbi:MAG: O-antigen ligase family protein [Gaiellaceae bacterium]